MEGPDAIAKSRKQPGLPVKPAMAEENPAEMVMQQDADRPRKTKRLSGSKSIASSTRQQNCSVHAARITGMTARTPIPAQSASASRGRSRESKKGSRICPPGRKSTELRGARRICIFEKKLFLPGPRQGIPDLPVRQTSCRGWIPDDRGDDGEKKSQDYPGPYRGRPGQARP